MAGVLVHCGAGISRASTVTIAYLMHSMGVSFREGYRIVKEARPFCHPNEGFVKQLKAYGKQLKARREKRGVDAEYAAMVKQAKVAEQYGHHAASARGGGKAEYAAMVKQVKEAAAADVKVAGKYGGTTKQPKAGGRAAEAQRILAEKQQAGRRRGSKRAAARRTGLNFMG